MRLENLTAGHHVPEDINVIIEIASKSAPVKYEIDKESGAIRVDRFLGTSMFYPCEYGFMPHTLAEDGDPVDVLVVTPYPLIPGSLIRSRAIGMLRMRDESGSDAKILAVPVNKVTPRYQDVFQPSDLGYEILNEIEHFFMHYKDLEKGKWTQIEGWSDAESAKQEILASVLRYQKK